MTKETFPPQKKNYIQDWIEHRRNLKSEKVKNKTAFNWTFFISVFCISIILLLITSIFIGGVIVKTMTEEVSKAMSEIINKNPEVALAYIDNMGANVPYYVYLASAMKETGFNTEGNFKGHFATEKVRTQEKVDLNCIDEYTYEKFNLLATEQNSTESERINDYLGNAKAIDRGCSQVMQMPKTIVFKCPKRNCLMREVVSEKVGQFIPDTIVIDKIGTDEK